jgi:hypothetical protein
MSKTTAPSKKEVVDAIISYSPDRLQHLIDLGYDLNLPLLGDEDEIKTYDLSQKIDAGLKEQIALDIRQGAVTMAFPLHVAVVSLYHAAKRGRTLNEYGIKQALKTFKILLANGALWCMGCAWDAAIELFSTQRVTTLGISAKIILRIKHCIWLCF